MTKPLELPPMSQEVILTVDMTPDDELPIRILQAYRQNCDALWVASPPSPIWDMMNEHQRERAVILDAAIAKLRRRD